MSLFCFSVVSSAFFFVARKARFLALVIFKEVDIAHQSLLVSDKTIPCNLAISALLYIIIMNNQPLFPFSADVVLPSICGVVGKHQWCWVLNILQSVVWEEATCC